MNRKDKSLNKQCFGIDTAPSFSTGLMSCQWYVVWSQPRNPWFGYVNFATVVMETMQLVLSQFKNFLSLPIEHLIRYLHAKNSEWTLWIGEVMWY